MHFLFRTDASLAIGTGHVVRCATLAGHLAGAGHSVQFFCRESAGNLIGWLESQQLPVSRLSMANETAAAEADDARASKAAIGVALHDWLIVDHYGLGLRWEQAMAGVAKRIMAIDDLGRAHECDLLLDQNYVNAVHQSYRTPGSAIGRLLLGPEFAQVRPEFSRLRAYSLARRRDKLARVLVFMGGSDPLNETTKALDGIALAGLAGLQVDVVIGGANPHRSAIESVCRRLQFPQVAQLHVQTPRMAELLSTADCVIGAGGTAIWERCVLGVPALVTILAANQSPIAETIEAVGAHRVLGWHDAVTAQDYSDVLRKLDGVAIRNMSQVAASLCDGLGVARVAAHLLAPLQAGLCPEARHA